MSTLNDHKKLNKRHTTAGPDSHRISNNKQHVEFVDNRPSFVKQRMLQNIANANSNQTIMCQGRNARRHTNKAATANALAAGRAGGVNRATTFGANWATLNWRTHIKNHNRSILKGQPVRTSNGKTIFNLNKGEQIVIDQGGRYWRHFDGVANYFDASGTAWPNLPAHHPTTHFLV